jgi:hypothetical protein
MPTLRSANSLLLIITTLKSIIRDKIKNVRKSYSRYLTNVKSTCYYTLNNGFVERWVFFRGSKKLIKKGEIK